MATNINVEVTRAERRESQHNVAAAVWRAGSGLEAAWGEVDHWTFPRSSSKPIQALPLLESGAGAALTPEQIALACASHRGAAIHTDRVTRWLADLDLPESALRCGSHMPSDEPARDGLIRAETAPTQRHNNCSGKHTGFLTLNKHLGGNPEYIDPDHPVQRAVRQAWAEVTEEDSPDFGIDGCSAPNHATTLSGLARAMASFAAASRSPAQTQIVQAMMAHPELVANDGAACTELMRAMAGRGAVKTGAEGVYVAILPEHGLGIALKAECGTTRAAEAAITALLSRYGVLDADHPSALALNGTTLRNHAGRAVGQVRARL